ncbi:MAG: hypothetical protein GYB58_20105 [Gammaproteobacteria bacterium]|nr:hypothetical protein [Gammaproteobacteria bacterium]
MTRYKADSAFGASKDNKRDTVWVSQPSQEIPDSAGGASKDNKRDTVWVSQPSQGIPDSAGGASGITKSFSFLLL